MTPAARLQAAIELLDLIVADARTGGAAADTLVQRYFATRRYAGGGDRRAVRELVFAAIRSMGEPPASGRAAMVGHARTSDPGLLALFGEGGHGPAALVDGEAEADASPAPGWLRDRLAVRFGDAVDAEIASLLGRAPLDLRVNRLTTEREAVLVELADAAPTPLAPDGLRFAAPVNVEALPAWREGRVEVQDEGSQLAALATAAAPGETVIDLCAGAGGKTLALAALMANRGRLIATDSDRGRLSRLPPRAARAGVTIAETRLLDPGRELERLDDLAGQADLVLVDAPCSGTGTWRRNPEARWRLTPARLDRLAAEQHRLLTLGARLVRPGGRLVYVVCSLLPEEGEGTFGGWLSDAPDFQSLPMRNPLGGADVTTLVLTPRGHGCDGFFIAAATRPC